MSHSHTGSWSIVALISWRQTTSGCSRSSHSCSSVWRLRIPLTFHVAIFIPNDRSASVNDHWCDRSRGARGIPAVHLGTGSTEDGDWGLTPVRPQLLKFAIDDGARQM